MLSRLLSKTRFFFRTHEQETFIDHLPLLKFGNDQQMMQSLKYVYDKREFIENCENIQDFVERMENYLLKKKKCVIPHLQCYYKMKEMKLINPGFKYNLYKKYFDYLIDERNTIKNENMEKFLWYIFEEYRFERSLFEEAASNHTLKLFEIYQYMTSLNDLPTWEPYIRVATMLKALGHEIKGHSQLPNMKVIQRIQHKYYPYIGELYTPDEMLFYRDKYRYDDPFVTMLCNNFLMKNASRYDSYLQRVQRVQIEKQYERHLQVMLWTDLTPFIKLGLQNYNLIGVHDDIQGQISDIFFRLCETSNMDLDTITQLLSIFLNNPNFMYFRREGIISRTLDSLATQGLEDYNYFSTDGFLKLLDTAPKMKIGKEAAQEMELFLCRQIKKKLVWNDGDIERMREFLEDKKYAGKEDLLKFLQAVETDLQK